MLTCMCRHIPKILHAALRYIQNSYSHTYLTNAPHYVSFADLESGWWPGFWREDVEMWVEPHLRFHLRVLFILTLPLLHQACHKLLLCLSETPVSLCSPGPALQTWPSSTLSTRDQVWHLGCRDKGKTLESCGKFWVMWFISQETHTVKFWGMSILMKG